MDGLEIKGLLVGLYKDCLFCLIGIKLRRTLCCRFESLQTKGNYQDVENGHKKLKEHVNKNKRICGKTYCTDSKGQKTTEALGY